MVAQRPGPSPSRHASAGRAILDLMMRTIVVAVVAVAALGGGCGGGGGTGARGAPPAPPAPVVAPGYDAARWIPARPTYAAAARSVRDAQDAVLDLIASFGALVDADAGELSLALGRLLVVDPLSPDALEAIGIDTAGGLAVFSEAIDPTFVVHLAAPEQTQAFFTHQRRAGMQARSVMVDGVEVFTTMLRGGLPASWAIADGWLWVHFALTRAGGGETAWFSSSRRPGAPAWAGDWTWAIGGGGQGARPAIAGFVDTRALIERVSQRIPAAIACARLLSPIGRFGVTLEADGKRLGGRLAVEVGAGAAAGIARAILPPSDAWSAAAARAPLAAQWNVDLALVRAWLAPCAVAFGAGPDPLEAYGVRTARAILHHYDHDKPTKSRGVAAFDLAHRTYATKLLDEIPGRSLIQRKRTFGPYQGHAIAIPFGPTIEYVLEDHLALAGLGEGELAAVAGPAGARGPLLAIDVSPPAMSHASWSGLLGMVNLRPDALLRWRELHLALALDGARLVLDVSGSRLE